MNKYVPTPIDLHTKKIDQSIRLIQAYNKWKPLTLAYSGGKDSDVVLHLCKLAKVPVTIVHNSTTIDYPGVISRAIRVGAKIQRPKLSFFKLVEKRGIPSMFRRFCCSELKEKYIGNPLLLGIRSSESVKRSNLYVEPSVCRAYSKTSKTELVLPIVHWKNDDIIFFHDTEHLKFHEHYYINGVFDVNRRVGCIGCPLQGDRGRADYKAFPKFFRRFCISYQQYVKTHRAVNDIYLDIVWHLFYSNHRQKQYEQTYYGLFKAPDPKEFLESYFNIELP